MSIIENPGKKLEARFVCPVCGCEYIELLKDCDIYHGISFKDAQTRIWATRDCPCCGLSNECKEQDFKEVVSPYD